MGPSRCDRLPALLVGLAACQVPNPAYLAYGDGGTPLGPADLGASSEVMAMALSDAHEPGRGDAGHDAAPDVDARVDATPAVDAPVADAEGCTPWWDPRDAVRLPLVLNARAPAFGSGHFATASFDHAALVARGLSRSDGSDVRVVWTDGRTYVERARILDQRSRWNQGDTRVWFRVGPEVADSAGRYVVYAGASGPPSALPADGSLVWDRVRSGEVTNAVEGTTSVALPGVVGRASFPVFQTRHANNRPTGTQLMARLTDGQLLLDRRTDEAPPLPIIARYFVVEAAAGLARQEIAVNLETEYTQDVAIGPVASTGETFTSWSKLPERSSLDWSANDSIHVHLAAVDRLRVYTMEIWPTHVARVHVVALAPGAVRVQRGTSALPTNVGSVDVALPTAVDPRRAFLVSDFTITGLGSNIGARLVHASLQDGNTVRLARGIAGSALPQVGWQVVELLGGERVLHGRATFAAGMARVTVPLGTTVDAGRAFALATAQAGGGQNVGETTFSSDDVPGVCSVTLAVGAAAVDVERADTRGNCIADFAVVELPPVADATVGATEQRPASICSP